jgi:hypothetical protein
MKHKEFLFEFSMEQILLLVNKRAERNKRVGKGEEDIPRSRMHPEAKVGNLADMYTIKRLMK